jgi:hypothetical protein
MSYRYLAEGLAGTIVSQDARQYMLATGWRRVDFPVRSTPGFFGRVAVFDRPDNVDEQVLIPLDENTRDYDARMAEAVWNLARWEKRPPEETAKDLLFAGSDVLRFKVASPLLEAGTLPLTDGLHLLDGIRTAILAAAHSVISPVRYHKRLSRNDAEELLSACRMGQTERGSFVATVACPLRAGDAEQAFINTTADPFARKATTLLIESTSELVHAIETDQVRQVVENENATPKLSANLCDALLRMKPSIEGAEVTIEATWSALRPVLTTVPAHPVIRIQNSYFPIIEDIYKELRPGEQALPTFYLAYLDKLEGSPGPDGRMQGSVVLRLFGPDDEDNIHARASLTPDQYALAVKAHANNRLVELTGSLVRARRSAKLDNPVDFKLVEIPS